MKLLTAGLLIASCLGAQSLPNDFVALGASYNKQINPPISGFGVYAKKITGDTYSFNVIDVTSKTTNPFTVQSTTSTGLAQYLGRFNGVDIFGLANIGIAAAGENVGLGYSGGFAFTGRIKGNVCFIVPMRIQKATIGDWQGTIGLGIGMRRD
jgi:hypothetical protein